MFSSFQENYYSALKLDQSASEKEIRKQFIQLAKAHHPDVSDDPKSKEMFIKINTAYQVLSNPEAKKQYDQLTSNMRSS